MGWVFVRGIYDLYEKYMGSTKECEFSKLEKKINALLPSNL